MEKYNHTISSFLPTSAKIELKLGFRILKIY
jgi:hypothetical protein